MKLIRLTIDSSEPVDLEAGPGAEHLTYLEAPLCCTPCLDQSRWLPLQASLLGQPG